MAPKTNGVELAKKIALVRQTNTCLTTGEVEKAEVEAPMVVEADCGMEMEHLGAEGAHDFLKLVTWVMMIEPTSHKCKLL